MRDAGGHSAALEGRDGVDLDEVERVASLQTRVDRKYLLPAHRGALLLTALHDSVAVLRINGASSFRYNTVYFDTPDLESYMSAAHRRRRRFKVRIRTYSDTAVAALEVKTKGRRGETVKVRAPYALDSAEILTPEAIAFIDGSLGRPGFARRLGAVMATTFMRTTLLDRRGESRTTIDRGLTLRIPDGGEVSLTGHSIVETKSAGAATEIDRWLWSQGHRPTSFSKFCVGMALHHPALPANKWNRTLRRDLAWLPDRPQPTRCALGKRHDQEPESGLEPVVVA